MARVERKDYAEAAIVAPSNPTFKRVRQENTPKSIRATGHDNLANKNKHIPVTEENLETIDTNTRVLQGNIEKHVKSITTTGVAPDEVFASMVIAYNDLDTGKEVTETWTKAEILASSSINFATTD